MCIMIYCYLSICVYDLYVIYTSWHGRNRVINIYFIIITFKIQTFIFVITILKIILI